MMMVSRIARLILPVFLFVLSCTLHAQDEADQHFIYIQTENNQLFYIRLNGKVFSSTAAGYVILPKLNSGNYQLFAGFPKNEFPEQEFHLTVSGVNEGFLLKKLGSEWTLFNIETMELTEGVNTVPVQSENKVKTTTVDSDPFATLLAGAVKDSSILQNDIVTTLPQSKQDTVQIQTAITDFSQNSSTDKLKADSATVVTTMQEVIPSGNNSFKDSSLASSPQTSSDATIAPVSNRSTPKENSIQRILLVNESGGLELVYVDHSLKDTVRILLPVSSDKITSTQTAKVIYHPPVQDTATLTITPTITPQDDGLKKQEPVSSGEKKPEPQSQIIYQPQPDTPTITEVKPKEEIKNADAKSGSAPQVIYHSNVNSDCRNFATNKDFFRLRKKMAAETDNDKMIEIARKYFRNTCYSTEQIRNLSYLFLNDEGRYKFFDAAYPYTSDSDQYSTLESQLKDPYYINRFRAMIHK